MTAFEETCARDAQICQLQTGLLDHSGHVNRRLARPAAVTLAAQINDLRAANGWNPLAMTGRWRRSA